MNDVDSAREGVQIPFIFFNLRWLLLRSQWGSGGVMPRLSGKSFILYARTRWTGIER